MSQRWRIYDLFKIIGGFEYRICEVTQLLLCSFFELYDFFAFKTALFQSTPADSQNMFFSSIEGVEGANLLLNGYRLIPIPTGAHQDVNRFWVPAELFVDFVLEKIWKLFEPRRDRKSLILI